MERTHAMQIIELLTLRNQGDVPYDADTILASKETFLYELRDEVVVACIEVKKVQWYQWEVGHLAVVETYEGQGLGNYMLQLAEQHATAGGAKILQCTIRVGNPESERPFSHNGYKQTSEFYNAFGGTTMSVWQKVVSFEVLL